MDPARIERSRRAHDRPRFPRALVALAVGLALSASTSARAAEPSFDGLEPVQDSKVAKAYVDPTADFGLYKRVKILTPYVAFRKNWKRDQDSERARRLTSGDIARIKQNVADLFEQVFREVLEAKGGYEVVNVDAEDVLLLRPAIIDLDIAAPDTLDADRESTYTASAGAATLYVELFDSISGKILGRAIDRQSVRAPGSSFALSNRATNTAEARRMFRRWAELLRDFLDRHYTK